MLVQRIYEDQPPARPKGDLRGWPAPRGAPQHITSTFLVSISGPGHLPQRDPRSMRIKSTWLLSQRNLGELPRAGLINDTPLSTSGHGMQGLPGADMSLTFRLVLQYLRRNQDTNPLSIHGVG